MKINWSKSGAKLRSLTNLYNLKYYLISPIRQLTLGVAPRECTWRHEYIRGSKSTYVASRVCSSLHEYGRGSTSTYVIPRARSGSTSTYVAPRVRMCQISKLNIKYKMKSGSTSMDEAPRVPTWNLGFTVGKVKFKKFKKS